MRVSSTVNANFSGLALKPGADTSTISGAAMMPSTATQATTTNRTVATRLTRMRVASSPRAFLYSARIGTKACENAPSANNRRSRFGNLKATKNASVAAPAPNARAMMASRAKPRMRDSKVIELTVARALSRFIESIYAEKSRRMVTNGLPGW